MRSDDRILTTHAGSLPQPSDLYEQLGVGAADPALVRRAVSDVVARQREIGIDVVSDGEQSKLSFTTYAAARLRGLETREDSGPAGTVADRARRDYGEYYRARASARPVSNRTLMFCTGPLEYVGHDALQADIDNLRAALAGSGAEEAFIPAVAPATLEHWIVNEYYADDESYLVALGDAMAHEYEAIVAAGFMLQIDNPDLPDGWGLYTDMELEAYRRFQDLRVETLNHALRNVPRDRVQMHVCWGATRGPHDSDVPLESIIDLVLRVNVGAYSFEAANARHAHEWKVWRDAKLPDDVVLIPGVVGHDSDTIEHPEVVAERIIRYAGIVGRERVVAGTDCGFATARGVHPSIVWAKLHALVAGAQLASKTLW